MDAIIDVQNYIRKLIADRIIPEDLVSCCIRNLYSLERSALLERRTASINNIHACVAYVKLLYDHYQQMDLSRKYLLHKIKLLEIRERDFNLENSILRGVSPLDNGDSLLCADVSIIGRKEVNCLHDLEVPNNLEADIAYDARVIREIDQSSGRLYSMIDKIEGKKNELSDIEHQIEDASSMFLPSLECSTSSMEKERMEANSSCRVVRTQVLESTNRSRVGGARIPSPKMDTNMETSQDNDINLPSQGVFGASRDRQSGEPDAVRSTSDKGTVGVASASAPTEQAVTAELDSVGMVSCEYEEISDAMRSEEISTLKSDKKRKASISPCSGIEDATGEMAWRPNKARIIESVDPQVVIGSDSDDNQKSDGKEVRTDASESYGESDNMQKSPTPEVRMTRAACRDRANKVDFSQLKALRQKKKAEKNENIISNEEIESSTFREDFIDLVVRRELDYSEDSKSQKSGSVYCESLEHNSDKTEVSGCYSSSNKKNKNKKAAADRAQKNPGQKSKRKPAVAIIVTQEEAEKELRMTRQDWLDMDPAAIGARCLDHLAEMEQQRSRCSNISGRVSGRMKDSGIVVTEIVKAMVEKLSCVGDSFALKNENFALKEELNEIKRKEKAQSNEMLELRKMIINLQREVKSLKEGFGPYSAHVTDPSRHQMRDVKRQFSSEKKLDNQKREKISSSPPLMVKETGSEMEVEPLIEGTPGCSTNEEYMKRKERWPIGEESIPWTEGYDKTEVMYKDNSASDNKIIPKPKYSKIKSNRANDNINIYNDNYDRSGNDYVHSDNYNYSNSDKINLVLGDKKLNKVSLEVERKSSDKGIRIIDNRQLVPPFRATPGVQDWMEVSGKRRPKAQKKQAQVSEPVSGLQRRQTASVREKAKPGRRLAKPAVVTITSRPDGLTYAQILAKAREKVNLKDLGIQTTVIRRALNGAVIIEVPGPQGKQLADTLRARLTDALGDDARVLNPVATGELRLRGIEPSTTQEEILMELETVSGLPRQDFKVSAITNMRDGMGVTWVTCPLQAAIKIAERGVVALGWTRVKVDLLRKRPVQCYKCWHFGHVRSNCKSEIDRIGFCFKCGIMGHTIGLCRTNIPSCLICKDIGCESRHKIGSLICLKNQGHPYGIQPIRKVSTSLRKMSQRSQASVFDDDRYD